MYFSYDPKMGLDSRAFEQIFFDNTAKKEVVEELLEMLADGSRTFINFGLPISLLVCGENNIIMNKQSSGNKEVHVRHFESMKNLDAKALNAQVVLNGSHTIMGNWGKLHYRFCKLSSNKRLYL